MSAYSRSLDKIQTSYQFTDKEMARMDYTLKVFFYETSKLLFYFLFFLCIGKYSEFVVCLIALLPLRWISGGLHLKHYWSCFLFSFLFFSVIILALDGCVLPQEVQIILLTLCNIFLYLIGPVTSEKRKTMTLKRYQGMRYLSSGILFVYTILYFVLENVPHRSIVFWSIILQIIQLFCARLVRKGEIYEKV
ncbi:MAG: accessory gene regulator B family protein [Eubacterium sp.]|nr:accessory gene regulator B family protein [Eubacterium sp.]